MTTGNKSDDAFLEAVPEIVLEVGDVKVVHQDATPDAPRSVFIRRPTMVARMRLLIAKKAEFEKALTKIQREKKEDFAYDFALAALAILQHLTREDGEDEVKALSVLADLIVQRQTQFHEEYAPFTRACAFVKGLAEEGAASIQEYLAAA